MSQPDDLDQVIMVEYNPRRNRNETYDILNKYKLPIIREEEEEEEDEEIVYSEEE